MPVSGCKRIGREDRIEDEPLSLAAQQEKDATVLALDRGAGVGGGLPGEQLTGGLVIAGPVVSHRQEDRRERVLEKGAPLVVAIPSLMRSIASRYRPER